MINKKFREAIAKYEKDTGVPIQIIDLPVLDNCIVAIIDGIVVYDYQKMLIELIKQMHGDKEGALARVNEIYRSAMSKPYDEREIHIGLGIDTFIDAYNNFDGSADQEDEKDSVIDTSIN